MALAIKQTAWNIARKLYQRLPLPSKHKIKIRMLVFKYIKLLSNKHSYRGLLLNPQGNIQLDRVLEDVATINLQQPLTFTLPAQPDVSIIIPHYNNINYTYACLRSITKNPSKYSFEIIVVDDCSSDHSREVFAKITGLRLITNEENLGFIRSCNKGAQAAQGKYLFFLNNDTQVLPGWLDELVDTFSAQAKVGLVGSKLIYPNGCLQEAGGIIWNDASGWNYGRFDDPNKPEYNYLRAADYCSGAAIMIPKDVFSQVGCFDEHYLPAYCEDSDLAFSIRKAGYKVLYQPLSQIVHFEGISSGTDLASGVKSYQVGNTRKFYDRWQTVLTKHRPNGNDPHLEKERAVARRVLFIDGCTPTPDQDAGSVTAFYFMKILTDLAWKVTFIPLDNFTYLDKYTANLQRLGIECLYAPYIYDVRSHLKQYGRDYDMVMLTRVDYAAACLADVRQYCPQAKVIFNTADLHYLRLQRQAEVERSNMLARRAEKVKTTELGVMQKTDCTIVVSAQEQKIILQECDAINVRLIQLLMEIPGRKLGFAQRNGIVFVGNYRHTPNADALIYFLEKIWPLVKQQIPEIVFYIIGANPPVNIQALASKDVKLVGYVADLADYFDRCRLSVAPLRYGAGVKGKVGMSLAYGLPCVATTMAAEGMGLSHEENVLIAVDENSFATEVVKLYRDEALWQHLSDKGLEFVENTYSENAGKRHITAMINELRLS